ncbi:TolC family protein [bacterium]|nr:TolC family protein [bacterium]
MYDALLEGFWLGEFDLVSVLDAQQRVFELRGRYLEALTAYQQALAELEGLIGAPLETSHGDATDPSTDNKEMQP